MNLISQLDDYCQQLESDRNLPGDFRTGPFGVFEAKSSYSASSVAGTTAADIAKDTSDTVDPIALDADATMAGAIAEFDQDTFASSGAGPVISIPEDPPSNDSSVEEIENISQQNLLGHDVGFNDDTGRVMPYHELWQLDDPFTFMGDFGISLDTADFMLLDSFDAATSAWNIDGHAGIPGPTEPPSKPHTPVVREKSDWSHLLTDAPSLLRCYQVDDAASEPAKQSFWKSFILPSAMRTFAELSVFGTASDVSSSVFYSTLANSAFALQRSDGQSVDESHWYTVGKSAEEAALYFLQSALRPSADASDCQDLLSAILSVALNSVCSPLSLTPSPCADLLTEHSCITNPIRRLSTSSRLNAS